jgi:hypothetical protein
MKWLQNEIKKDQEALEREKLEFINQIKNFKKDTIVPDKPKKLTLWQRIKMILTQS